MSSTQEEKFASVRSWSMHLTKIVNSYNKMMSKMESCLFLLLLYWSKLQNIWYIRWMIHGNTLILHVTWTSAVSYWLSDSDGHSITANKPANGPSE